MFTDMETPPRIGLKLKAYINKSDNMRINIALRCVRVYIVAVESNKCYIF
jgi:hypothetical protein